MLHADFTERSLLGERGEKCAKQCLNRLSSGPVAAPWRSVICAHFADDVCAEFGWHMSSNLMLYFKLHQNISWGVNKKPPKLIWSIRGLAELFLPIWANWTIIVRISIPPTIVGLKCVMIESGDHKRSYQSAETNLLKAGFSSSASRHLHSLRVTSLCSTCMHAGNLSTYLSCKMEKRLMTLSEISQMLPRPGH